MAFYDRFFKAKPVAQPAKRVQPDHSYRNAILASASNRLTNNWTKVLRSPNREIENDLRAARSLSRHLTYNSVFVSRFLQLLRTNVIGPKGMQMVARVMGPDGNYNETVNQVLVGEWERWKDVADIRGIDNFTELEAKVLHTTAMDGECFIHLVTDSRVNKYGLALKFIDADLLDPAYTVGTLANGNSIVQGIEVDSITGRPVAFHFWNRDPEERVGQPVTRVRIPADEIIHLARPVRSGQYRGLPWIVPAMEFLARLDEYMDAELIAAQAGACQMATIESDNLTDASIYQGTAAPTGVQEIQDIQPGMMIRLAPGEKMKPWVTNHPNNAFPQFVSTILLGTSAALGVSYNALTGDMSQDNYSSGRLGSINERDYYRQLQAWLIRVFHERVFKVWLQSSLTMNALRLPTNNPADYSEVTFRSRGWKWVDPKKDFEAYETAINMNLISKGQVCAEQGMDYREVLEERYEEQRLEGLYAQYLKQDLVPTDEAPVTEEQLDNPDTTTTPTTEEEVDGTTVEESPDEANETNPA